jgi:hypothetical protein
VVSNKVVLAREEGRKREKGKEGSKELTKGRRAENMNEERVGLS